MHNVCERRQQPERGEHVHQRGEHRVIHNVQHGQLQHGAQEVGRRASLWLDRDGVCRVLFVSSRSNVLPRATAAAVSPLA